MNLYFVACSTDIGEDMDHIVVAQTSAQASDVFIEYMAEWQNILPESIDEPRVFEIPAFPSEQETARVLLWDEDLVHQFGPRFPKP